MQEGHSRLKKVRRHGAGAGYRGLLKTHGIHLWWTKSEMKARILHYSDLSADLQEIRMGILAKMLNLRGIKQHSFRRLHVH